MTVQGFYPGIHEHIDLGSFIFSVAQYEVLPRNPCFYSVNIMVLC